MSSFSEPELIRQFNELDDGGASAWHANFMRLKNASLEGAGGMRSLDDEETENA